MNQGLVFAPYIMEIVEPIGSGFSPKMAMKSRYSTIQVNGSFYQKIKTRKEIRMEKIEKFFETLSDLPL